MSVTARILSAAACILAGAGLFSLPAHAADWKSGVPRTAYVNLFESIAEVQDYATNWLWIYNHERPNMALGGITPNRLARNSGLIVI